jgi:peptidoglycan hydrolase-like protein with peptidoglycan-binding domain
MGLNGAKHFGRPTAPRVDGECGPLTTEAVKQFQRTKGLEVDGWAGDLTHAALQAAISKA